MIRETIK